MDLPIDKLVRDFKRKVCADIQIVSEGEGRFIVRTPFTFDDGDALPIVLKASNGGWVFTDEGQTFMELLYELDEGDLERGGRPEIIESTLAGFGIENRHGELVLPVRDRRFGDALYSFIHAVMKLEDVRYLSQPRVKSTFTADFRAFVERQIRAKSVVWDWTDPTNDPKGNYPVDVRIDYNGRPLFMFALPAEDKVKDATINILNFEKWRLSFNAVGVFEDYEKIGKKTFEKFLNVCGKVFTDLRIAEQRFGIMFPELTSGALPVDLPETKRPQPS